MANLIPPVPIGSDPGSYAWIEWYRELTDQLNSGAKVPWAQLDFTNSKIEDLAEREHDNLQKIQGTSDANSSWHLLGLGIISGTSLTAPSGWSYVGSGADYIISFPTPVADMTKLVVTITPMASGASAFWTPTTTSSFTITVTGTPIFSFMVSVLEETT